MPRLRQPNAAVKAAIFSRAEITDIGGLDDSMDQVIELANQCKEVARSLADLSSADTVDTAEFVQQATALDEQAQALVTEIISIASSAGR